MSSSYMYQTSLWNNVIILLIYHIHIWLSSWIKSPYDNYIHFSSSFSLSLIIIFPDQLSCQINYDKTNSFSFNFHLCFIYNINIKLHQKCLTSWSKIQNQNQHNWIYDFHFKNKDIGITSVWRWMKQGLRSPRRWAKGQDSPTQSQHCWWEGRSPVCLEVHHPSCQQEC